MPSKLKPKVLYEAAALAVKAFKEHELEPGGMANLEVEIRKTITHTLTVKRASRMVEWRL